MKDFDKEFAERDSLEARTFRFGGEMFVRKATIRPEALFEEPEPFKSDDEAVAWSDNNLLSMIEDIDDGHARYRALRAREENPIGLADMLALKRWLVGEFSGRPTNAPSPSGNGRASGGTGSTAKSSSTAARG